MSKEKKIVLVIDDNVDIRDLVARTLQGTEFHVLQASDGSEGIQIAKEHKPDVILLDIMMPKYDGFMVGKVLKRNINTKEIPIIFLSAKKTKQDINTAVQAGGSDYIVKPFSPSDLMTRLRRVAESKEVKIARKKEDENKKLEKDELLTKQEASDRKKQLLISIKQHYDVIVFSSRIGSIAFENFQIYRDAFTNIVSDGIFKLVFDMGKISRIDGSGLALLLSLNESLKSNGGGLKITFPTKEVINQFSFININYLFKAYNTIEEAVESFKQLDIEQQESSEYKDLNICLSCAYVNSSESRFCGNCGTNILIGKREELLEILGRSILKNVLSEAGTIDIQKINKSRNIEVENHKIPSEFNVELLTDDVTIIYKSTNTDSQNFEKNQQIAITSPIVNGKIVPLMPNIKVHLKNTEHGMHTVFESRIDAVDEKRGMIVVHYTEDAKALHSQKNFSVAPKIPIPVSLIVPTLYSGEMFKGKILELSRKGMMVFSEEAIPQNQCMALNFSLPDGREISSPLVIARKGKERFMFDVEFITIDENERTNIIQYMYRRQIALVRMK